MILRPTLILLCFALFSYSANAQTEQQTKEKTQQEKKLEEAKVNGGKADALLQKNDIYDKDIMERKENREMVRTRNFRQQHERFHFRKRKLYHRLRRRR